MQAHDDTGVPASDPHDGDGYVDGVLRHVVSLSETMLADASAGQWERVNERETERQRLVWGLFATHPHLAECPARRVHLQHVHQLSEALVQLAESERERAGESSARARQARRVHQAYADQMA